MVSSKMECGSPGLFLFCPVWFHVLCCDRCVMICLKGSKSNCIFGLVVVLVVCRFQIDASLVC